MSDTGWRFANASVIGTSHLKQEPAICQDFSYCEASQVGEDEVFLAIAADGAGSASHSAEGAKTACESVREFFCQFASVGRSVTEIDRDTAVQCITKCRFKLTELASTVGLPPREFACTLLVAMVSSNSSAFFQVGDGAIVVDGIDCEPFNYIFWPDRGEYENTTVFVTQEEALEHLQFDLVDRPIRKLAVFTDGIQHLALNLKEHVPHAPFFSPLFSHLSNCPQGRSDDYTYHLQQFLASDRVNSRTDDDKTLIVAVRN